MITHVQIAGDTLHVFDANGRWVMLDRQSGREIRRVSVPRHQEKAVLPDGRLVLTGPVGLRQTAGYPLHVFTGTGAWQRSFGLDTPDLHPEKGFFLGRVIHPAEGAGFWTAPWNEYRLELWRPDGRLVRTLIGRRDWFVPWYDDALLNPQRANPPPPLIGAIFEDAGLLWVHYSIAAPGWANALSSELDPMGNPQIRPDRRYRVAGIEIIDPNTGRLLLRRLFDDDLYPCCLFAGPGALFRTWDDEHGVPHAEVIPARFVRP
jgi:hypothetical protein